MLRHPSRTALIRFPLLTLALFLLVPVPTARGQEQLLQEAVEAVKMGNFDEALALYRQLERSSDPWYAWAGTSGQVVVHRMAGDGDSARAVTGRVAAGRAELAGLMAVWDGDTAILESDFGRAVAAYRYAADRHGKQRVDGSPIGTMALRQLSRAYLDSGDALTAAETERELLRGYPQFVDREATAGRILAFEAMASGQLPVKPLERLLHDGDCSPKQPCVIGRGRVGRELTGDARPLGQLEGLYFVPERSMAEVLETRSVSSALVAGSRAEVCKVPVTKSGFTKPMLGEKGGGYAFMESPDCCGGFHTGIDLNRGGFEEDCNDPFYSAAAGCVRDAMSSENDWGSAAIEHRYPPGPWVSQYGHAYEVYVSVDQAVGKGALIGKVGNVGTGACHLHFEIREADHGDLTNASAYTNHNGTMRLVGDEYQNPLPFIQAHKGYRKLKWYDEEKFRVSGQWTSVAGVGDEDDMKWAETTPTDSPNVNSARLDLKVPKSGTWELWAFIPYESSTDAWSAAAPYRLLKMPGKSPLGERTVEQSGKKDEWVKIGSALLSAQKKYRIEVATNTGEDGRKVALDDFLLILPPATSLADLVVGGIQFSPPPTRGVKTTAIASLRNAGEAASGEFRVKWFLDNELVGYGLHTSLDPGQVSNGNIRFDWTPTKAQYELQFVADVDGDVDETRETNNSARVKVNTILDRADLKVSGIRFTTIPTVGEVTTAVAELANVGSAVSGAFRVKWFLDGLQVGYGLHELLDPDEVSNGNIRFNWTPTAGTHTLQFVADADNDVVESNEGNNSATVPVDPLPSPAPPGLSGEEIKIYSNESVRTEAQFLQDGVFRIEYAGEEYATVDFLYRLRHNKELAPNDEYFHVVLKMISGPAGTVAEAAGDEVAGWGIPSYYGSGSCCYDLGVGDVVDLGEDDTEKAFAANMKDGYFQLEIDFDISNGSVPGGYYFSIERIYSVDKVTSQETTLWSPPW